MRFPEKGQEKQSILTKIKSFKSKDAQWAKGRCFSYVYYPGDEMSDLLKNAYTEYFCENALNPSAFPSLKKMETEVISMVANLLGGDNDVCGTMTSGGTESILMAIKTAREWAKLNKPQIQFPEVILPISAHPAFQKAFHYFGIKHKLVKLDNDLKADVAHLQTLINENTIMLVASAPSYPHGIMDPIEDIAQIALKNNFLFHVDACVGGFVLPFLNKLGYKIPPFDFSVDGVTSMSCDIHKYGYSAKGASVILHKNKELRKHQFFVYSDWTGGIYGSPSVSGTRSGGSIAAAWSAINYQGIEGYTKMTKTKMDITQKVKDFVESKSEINIIGEPVMCIFAIGSDKIDIYEVGDELNIKDWFIDKQQFPPSIHLSINYMHKDIIDEFIKDFDQSISKADSFDINKLMKSVQIKTVENLQNLLPDEYFKKFKKWAANKSDIGGKRTAAMYGMMGSLREGDEGVDEMVLEFLDKLNSLD